MEDKNIVIIDDQSEIRETLTDLIDNYLSLRAVSFESVDSFLAYLDDGKKEVDLVISDVHMPTGSGLRLNIEFEKRKIETPVIFVSGMADHLPRSKNITIIRKPFAPDSLIETITKLLK